MNNELSLYVAGRVLKGMKWDGMEWINGVHIFIYHGRLVSMHGIYFLQLSFIASGYRI